jgi:2,3,4,5-tetrahydropyridine-2,6-dicarboxylate N-succinyltransferase
LLSFRLNPMEPIPGGPGGSMWWDKVPPKFAGWDAERFAEAEFRAVPGAIVRRGAYIGKGVVLMPSFVNIGAYVGQGTMVDTWASIGSCAQIGRNVHVSAGAGIGGVLEPLQANPTIIEDNCFIGARSEVVEGVVVEEGSVLSMGVFISASTRIVDRATGQVFTGRVPSYSVVVPGALPAKDGGPSLACAVIVKRVDAQTRSPQCPRPHNNRAPSGCPSWAERLTKSWLACSSGGSARFLTWAIATPRASPEA